MHVCLRWVLLAPTPRPLPCRHVREGSYDGLLRLPRAGIFRAVAFTAAGMVCAPRSHVSAFLCKLAFECLQARHDVTVFPVGDGRSHRELWQVPLSRVSRCVWRTAHMPVSTQQLFCRSCMHTASFGLHPVHRFAHCKHAAYIRCVVLHTASTRPTSEASVCSPLQRASEVVAWLQASIRCAACWASGRLARSACACSSSTSPARPSRGTTCSSRLWSACSTRCVREAVTSLPLTSAIPYFPVYTAKLVRTLDIIRLTVGRGLLQL